MTLYFGSVCGSDDAEGMNKKADTEGKKVSACINRRDMGPSSQVVSRYPEAAFTLALGVIPRS